MIGIRRQPDIISFFEYIYKNIGGQLFLERKYINLKNKNDGGVS